MPKVGEGRAVPTDSHRCITPLCVNSLAVPLETYHGLCLKCYSQAKKMIESGKTTWEQLVEMGLAKTEQTPFEKAFEDAAYKKVKEENS